MGNTDSGLRFLGEIARVARSVDMGEVRGIVWPGPGRAIAASQIIIIHKDVSRIWSEVVGNEVWRSVDRLYLHIIKHTVSSPEIMSIKV